MRKENLVISKKLIVSENEALSRIDYLFDRE